jgi:hypothetical protein
MLGARLVEFAAGPAEFECRTLPTPAAFYHFCTDENLADKSKLFDTAFSVSHRGSRACACDHDVVSCPRLLCSEFNPRKNRPDPSTRAFS